MVMETNSVPHLKPISIGNKEVGTVSKVVIKVTNDLELIASLEQLIPEFENHYSAQKIKARLDNRQYLALVAFEGAEPVAYKVGYQETPNRFYSWIGGVKPAYRRRGWAKKLLHQQESWCREQGYGEINVWTANQYRGMLIFLLHQGYDIFAVAGDGKVLLRKLLGSN